MDQCTWSCRGCFISCYLIMMHRFAERGRRSRAETKHGDRREEEKLNQALLLASISRHDKKRRLIRATLRYCNGNSYFSMCNYVGSFCSILYIIILMAQFLTLQYQ
ncbi:unnamed protein product [Musa textilis]